MSQVHITEPDHPHRSRLDHRDMVASGVGHCFPQSRSGHRFAVMLVICDQPGRRGFVTREDRGDELISQRPGEGKLRDRQILRQHNGKPSGLRRLQARPPVYTRSRVDGTRSRPQCTRGPRQERTVARSATMHKHTACPTAARAASGTALQLNDAKSIMP